MKPPFQFTLRQLFGWLIGISIVGGVLFAMINAQQEALRDAHRAAVRAGRLSKDDFSAKYFERLFPGGSGTTAK